MYYLVSAKVNDELVIVELKTDNADYAQEAFFDLYEFNPDGSANLIGDITIR